VKPRLPEDPLTPASRGQTLVVGAASLIAGIAFLVFAALTVHVTSASGRIGQPSVILLLAVMLVIGVGFIDVAVAIFRKKGKSRSYLLSNTTLYVSGCFLFIIPLLLVGVSILGKSQEGAWSALKVLSVSSLGLLAIRLARIRSKRSLTKR
jgi:Na+-driven multidrug efflux pump